MSVNDLRARMLDIPGIDGLTMQLLGGRQCFSWGNGMLVAVDPMATDQEIETAIRNASRLPPVSMIPDKPKEASMSSVTGARSASASLKQMMDQAKQSVADGMAEVQAGIEKHAKAGAADASRGGGALIGTARILSTLFAMTDDEAGLMNIAPEDRTKYVRFDDAKANLSLVTGQAKWFEKKSVKLDNSRGLIPGDEVGVLAPWDPPGMLDGVSMFTITQILDTIDRGLMDESGAPTGQFYTATASGPSKDRWAGKVVVRLLGCEEKLAKRLLKDWLENEVLETYEYMDPVARKPRSGTRSILNNRPDRPS